jgi:hypothetical protein
MTENGIVTMDDWEDEFQDYVPVFPKPEDYYDLIELPNGRHVPVPIAKRLVGERLIEELPVSRKVRDSKFFYCVQCDQYQTMMDKLCIPQTLIAPLQNGYSFFKCKQHKPSTQKGNDAKEAMLVRLILSGMYRTLRYVEAQR